MRLGLMVEVQHHDHVEEQHHDGTCIDNNVHHRQELGLEQQLVAGDTEECKNKIQYAMHRILGKYYQQSAEYPEE